MKYLFVAFLVMISVSGFTQQNHFIYIQADNRQPFYIKLEKRLLSSSASGYLIIPKLRDSAYKLLIGFPKNEWPEQKVTCSLNDADAGYLLKNFGEKGWGLFNLQTMGLVMADTSKNDDMAVVKDNKEDAFANILSAVVNDPGIRNAEKTEPDSAAVTKPVKKKTDSKVVVKKEVKLASKDKGKTRIAKLSDKKSSDSLRLVYVDIVKGKADTINVVIPVSKPVVSVPKPKLTKPDAGLVKVTKKQKNPAKDTATNALPIKKTKEMVAAIIKPVTLPAVFVKDTVAHTIAKTKPVADIASNTPPHILPDTVMVTGTIAKVEEPVIDLTKTINKDSVVDTAATVQQEIKKEDSTTSLVKADTINSKPGKEIVQDPVVKVDTVVAKAVEVAVVEKRVDTVVAKPVEVAVVEKKIDTVAMQKIIIKPLDSVVAGGARVFSPCKQEASGDEFLSLKKKMDKGKSDNEMLFYVHKAFTKMCYTTKQIERLSTSFTNDDGKYKLFDDAYQYVADRENFATLVEQLKDPYYIGRFKAMIH